MTLQEPETIELGSCMTSTPRGLMHEQKDTFQYVPLVDGLKSLLKKKEIFKLFGKQDCFEYNHNCS